MQSLLGKIGRSAAYPLMGLGIFLFAVSALFTAGILMEGVTHRSGEGQVERPETPAQTQSRLVFIAGFAGTAAVGWTLARLGDCFRRGGRLPHVARLTAEMLMLLGGFGLAVGFFVWWGHRLAAYRVVDDYRRAGIGAAVAGPVLLALGGALYRRSARNVDPV
jgi:hypothetical protein